MTDEYKALLERHNKLYDLTVELVYVGYDVTDRASAEYWIDQQLKELTQQSFNLKNDPLPEK